MKRVLIFFLPILLLFCAAQPGAARDNFASPVAIQTYKDIPGVTETEIAAIEALKADSASFGVAFDMATNTRMKRCIRPKQPGATGLCYYGDGLTPN
jgi:hypothetical protein